MAHRDVVDGVAVVVATMLLLMQCQDCHSQHLKRANACYGNTNNFLHLACEPEHYIHVLWVIHAAKPKTSGCIGPFGADTYRRECCAINLTDCTIKVQDGSSLQCQNKTTCDPLATWSNTNKGCDQDIFPSNTNYMFMEYMCRPAEFGRAVNSTTTDHTSSTPLVTTQPDDPTTATSPPTTATSPPTTTTTSPPTTTTSPPTTTTSPPTTTLTSPVTTTSWKTVVLSITNSSTFNGKASSATAAQAGSHRGPQEEELSDAMVSAIVGGCLGMMLTFVVFVFYWGRKRHLRVVGKPQPSVWDYLLSQTFTVRGTKGYDHFSNIRSSASSEGDPNSPVVRKNIWLPNIVDKDDKAADDAISNYENNSDRYHRVEIHHNASPSAYAILNLHASNVYQDTTHEV